MLALETSVRVFMDAVVAAADNAAQRVGRFNVSEGPVSP